MFHKKYAHIAFLCSKAKNVFYSINHNFSQYILQSRLLYVDEEH